MDILTYALAKSYTDKALLGVGTIKGAPCTVKSQTEDDEYVYVTLGWENNLGTSEETVVKIKKGADGAPGDPGPQGVSITKIEKIKTEDLIDTYQISFSDNTTFEYTISNGSTDYLKITNKPSIEGVELIGNKTFEDLNIASADALNATDENLQNLSNLIGDKTSLPAPTDTVVNNIASVDAKVDAIIDDNEVGLAKTFSSDKITKTFATKEEIPTVPNKVSELTNDSNYQTAEQVNSTITTEIAKVVADAPEDLNTLKEMSDWIAGHEDDASAMNSAISDNKIAITALQTGKADKSEIPTTLPANGGNADTVNNHTVETDVPVDAVFTDTIYDDTEVKESIEELNSNLDTLEYSDVAGGANIWNEKYVVGKIDTSGVISDYSSAIRSDYFEVKPSTKYTLIKNTPNFFYAFYDENKTVIGSRVQIAGGNRSVTTPSNAKYMIIMVNGVTTYDNSIAIIEGDATSYKPYIPSVKMLADEVSAQNESLDTLEYGDTHGGKNLLDFYTVTDTTGNAFENKPIYLKVGTYTASCVVTPTDLSCVAVFYGSDKTTEVGRCGFNGANNTFTLTSDAHYWRLYFPKDGTISNMQIEKGTQATDYEPYIPSVKMLAEENSQQSNEIMDLKMLGWTVPKECPIQNEVNGNQFIQKVGRVNLGSLTWYYVSNRFYTVLEGGKHTSNYNGVDAYCDKYNNAKDKDHSTFDNKEFSIGSNFASNATCSIVIRDDSYTNESAFKTAMQGVYLYYELETEKTINIDGNEVTERINDSLEDYGIDNKCPELGQGYCNFSGTDNEFQWISQPTTFVGTKMPIDCVSGDTVRVLFDVVQNNIVIQWNDGTHARVDNANELSAVVPSGVTKCCAYCATQDLTPTTIGNVRIYVNNAIDELKNDLDTLELSEVAGGKNLFDGKIIVGEGIYAYAKLPKSNVHISISDRDINVDISNISFGLSNTVVPNTDTMNWAFVNNGTIVGRDSNDVINSSFTAKSLSIFPNDANTVTKILQRFNIQIEEGDTATHYEPYIPSVKMLAEEVDNLNESLDKLNSLPKGFIIQIEADKDDIETTKQKYGWQYLGTSNISYESGSANILVTNVYRKNN